MKVFLGGTCGDSTWREDVIKQLDAEGIDYFNPVVEDWTPGCIKEEYRQKENECDVHLYVITKEMVGVFNIAEAVDSTHNPEKVCVFQVIEEGFDLAQRKSLEAVAGLISKRSGHVYIGSDFPWITGGFNH